MTFDISKDIGEEKITGYTYQGQPIVLGRKRGRPAKTRAKPGWYPIETKISAACIYAVTGDAKVTSDHTGIPVNQLKSMMAEVWWQDTIEQVRREENDQITAKMTKIVDQSLDAIEDRLLNGDHVLVLDYEIDPETGAKVRTRTLMRVPVKMKDISSHVGIITDKRQLLRGQATSITERTSQEDQLKKLGDKFEQFAKQVGVKEPKTIEDVAFTEVKNG